MGKIIHIQYIQYYTQWPICLIGINAIYHNVLMLNIHQVMMSWKITILENLDNTSWQIRMIRMILIDDVMENAKHWKTSWQIRMIRMIRIIRIIPIDDVMEKSRSMNPLIPWSLSRPYIFQDDIRTTQGLYHVNLMEAWI